jgi:arabinogalactan oligomer/maltooligosaccharide transport system permease protein
MIRKTSSLLVLFLFSFIAVFPILYVVAMATHDNSAFAQRLTELDWMQADLKNFKKLILETEFLIWLRNSVLISITVSMVGVSLSSMAGYAIARYRFPGHNWILRSLLTTQMFPASMLMLPMFVVLTQLKLINSFVGLLVVYSSSALPFCIWQMKGFFETVPKELEEAARLDGLSAFQTFYRVILPVASPALVVTGLFTFMTSWSEYMIAAIVLQDPALYTLPLGLKSFQASIATDWGLYAAASLIISTPIVALFLALSRFLVSGLTVGSVKG